MAKMPIGIGYQLSNLRGYLNYHYDREWRNFLAGVKHVKSATKSSLRLIKPEATEQEIDALTLKRFQVFSREEWETACFSDKLRIRKLYKHSILENVELLLEDKRDGRGLVLLTCHFDSFTLGLLILGLAGLHTNGMSSAVVEDQRLPLGVRLFFNKKYQNMEQYMGLTVKHQEHDRLFFYRVLEKGEALLVLGELPASPGSASVRLPFMGKNVMLAGGPWRMACKTGSLIAAYVCLCEGPGKYRVICHPPVDPSSGDALSVLNPIYEFFESFIRRYPERWWASDLLNVYQ